MGSANLVEDISPQDELAVQLINVLVYSMKLYLARSSWTKEPPFTSLESALELKS